MDTSKHIFQLHGVNGAEEPVLRKKLRRKEMFAFFERLAPTVIAIETRGASHHCARLLHSFGHTVKLIAPQLHGQSATPGPRLINALGEASLAAHYVGETPFAARREYPVSPPQPGPDLSSILRATCTRFYAFMPGCSPG